MSNKEIFLHRLADLSRELKVVITGCGCCGSPAVYDAEDKDLTPEHRYVCKDGMFDTHGEHVSWECSHEPAE